jgi:hypothetical protein
LKAILKLLIVDVVKFFITYAILAVIVEKITANLPRSWDPTGWGMLAMIVLFAGFVVGSFKVGAAYSDDLEEQEPGTIWGILRRPLRSIKYGLISMVLSFGLLYLVLWVSSYFTN